MLKLSISVPPASTRREDPVSQQLAVSVSSPKVILEPDVPKSKGRPQSKRYKSPYEKAIARQLLPRLDVIQSP